jgi:D-alanyl-D-alanine carboxypeptidase
VRASTAPVRATLLVLATLLAVAALLVRTGGGDLVPGGRAVGKSPAPGAAAPAAPASPEGTQPTGDPYGVAPAPVRIAMRFKQPPRSGLLFDLRTGRVLWSRGAPRRRPVASLAKMMTAIVVVDRARADEPVLISPAARATDGSKVGVLPPHRDVRLETLLHGLLLTSGNDAAVALAEHVGGSVPGFVAEMNSEAERMGLTCTHFSSPHGLQDRGNTACVRDLAVLAREVLARPRLARIVRTRLAVLPGVLPHTVKRGKRTLTVWRPGRLWFANHNPLIRAGYPGTTGVKTGYTDAAGRCLVATARHGRRSLGVVLLHSPDPGGQATRLLNRGFGALARAARVKPRTARIGRR